MRVRVRVRRRLQLVEALPAQHGETHGVRPVVLLVESAHLVGVTREN